MPMATRLILVKADGSVLLHSDTGGYKPLPYVSTVGRCHGASATA